MTLRFALKKAKLANKNTVKEALIFAEETMIDEHWPLSDFEELWQESDQFKKNHDIQMKIELAEKEMIAFV